MLWIIIINIMPQGCHSINNRPTYIHAYRWKMFYKIPHTIKVKTLSSLIAVLCTITLLLQCYFCHWRNAIFCSLWRRISRRVDAKVRIKWPSTISTLCSPWPGMICHFHVPIFSYPMFSSVWFQAGTFSSPYKLVAFMNHITTQVLQQQPSTI